MSGWIVFAEFCLSLETCSKKKDSGDGEPECTPCLFSLFDNSTMFCFDCKWTHKKEDIQLFIFSYLLSLYDQKWRSILSLFCCYVKKIQQNAPARLPTPEG